MKKMLASDTAFKIYSILIAIFLWVFVVYNQNPESTKLISGVNISYSNAATLENAGLVILKSDRSPTIDVSAKGRRLSLGKLDSSNISASVTVPEIHTGVYDVNVDVRLPINDVSIVDKNPYTIEVTVEHMKRASVPVEIKYTGTAKDEHSAVQATVYPKEIFVWGPESVINTVSSAQVEFNIADAQDGVETKAAYKLIATNGSDITNNVNINTDTSTVTLTPMVYQTTDVPIKARYTGTPASGYTISGIEALPAQIKLASKDGSSIDTNAIYTEPIDVSGLSADKKLSAKLIIPDNLINVLSVTEVELIVDVEHNITRTFKIENINFENAENGKQYNAQGLPMEITLYGPESAFATYIPVASVDVGHLNPGEHLLPVKLTLPESLVASSDYNISVVVTETAIQTPIVTTSPEA